MRAAKRALLGTVVASLACVLFAAAPAQAKGATHASVTGPGLQAPVELGPIRTGTLTSGTSLYTGLAVCRQLDRCRDRPPTGDLGPRYTVTYTMLWPGSNGHETRSTLRQYIYPDAKPNPLAYVPAGQSFVQGTRTVGSTFVISDSLFADVTSIGATRCCPSIAPPPVPQPAALTDSNTVPLVLGAFAIAAIALVLVLTLRHRRHPAPLAGSA